MKYVKHALFFLDFWQHKFAKVPPKTTNNKTNQLCKHGGLDLAFKDISQNANYISAFYLLYSSSNQYENNMFKTAAILYDNLEMED